MHIVENERCLNFDFIGTNPDESTEDVGTIQAPMSWRAVLQDPATTELLFDFYAKMEPPRSSKAMEAIILLSSIRRSCFPTDKERAAFLRLQYLKCLELAASFTVQSIRNWQYSTNSIHYLLALWGRLVAAVPYVRPKAGARGHVQHLEKQVLLVTETYIESMLDSVETVLRSDGALDDPLDDDGSLMEQLDQLPASRSSADFNTDQLPI
jgi:exportin-7